MKVQDGRLHIVWAGRFIPLKHPEYVVRLAGTLRDKGCPFFIRMLGDGELEPHPTCSFTTSTQPLFIPSFTTAPQPSR